MLHGRAYIRSAAPLLGKTRTTGLLANIYDASATPRVYVCHCEGYMFVNVKDMLVTVQTEPLHHSRRQSRMQMSSREPMAQCVS